jgi:ornithine carbamoyltransferase
MWQRFTERARRVVFFAQEEAGRLGENYVGAEHLLLGLVREQDSVAARVLDHLGVPTSRVRSELERQVTRGNGRLGQDMQLTPKAKVCIDMAYDEARQLNNNYIGTEHLLLGLIRASDLLAGRILAKLGIDLERTRKVVMELQDTDSAGMPNNLGLCPVAERPLLIRASEALKNDAHHLKGTSLLSIADLSPAQLVGILKMTAALDAAHKAKAPVFRWQYPRALAMIFEKPSLRTRVSFEFGMQQLGGITVNLGPADIRMGERESVADVAHNLERMADAIMARVFKHEILEELRLHSRIPIINGLSDREHPCQTLADLYTLQQKKGTLEGLRLAYIGDGNNVLHSLLLGCALIGVSIAAACPKGYEPLPDIVDKARELAGDASKVVITQDTAEAVEGADAVYTDVWTSMGQEQEQLARIQAFRSYQVNGALMAKAKPDAIFMHCLPAHRGDEVTDEVVDGPQSVVFDQAENRMHAQKAVLALTIGM